MIPRVLQVRSSKLDELKTKTRRLYFGTRARGTFLTNSNKQLLDCIGTLEPLRYF